MKRTADVWGLRLVMASVVFALNACAELPTRRTNTKIDVRIEGTTSVNGVDVKVSSSGGGSSMSTRVTRFQPAAAVLRSTWPSGHRIAR